MRTSLNEIKLIEEHLCGQTKPEEKLLLYTKKTLDTGFYRKVGWQKKAYAIIKAFGRKQLKNEINEVHQQMVIHPEHSIFQQQVHTIFPNL